MSKPAVFLDRDNTLIHNDGDLGDPERVELMQGVSTAVASLKGLGYRVVVVTNQGGVARGKYGEADVKAVHARLGAMIEAGANGAHIDAFYYCPFHPDGRLKQYRKEHPNRKPSPGMLLEAAADHDLDLSRSWMIGDQMRDVQAGAAAGCRTILLREDAATLSPLDIAGMSGVTAMAGDGADDGEGAARRGDKPDFMAASLIDAVRIVAQARPPESREESREGTRRWDAAAVAKLQRRAAADVGAKSEGGEQDAGDVKVASPSAARPVRPFRPWNAPEPEGEDEGGSVGVARRGRHGGADTAEAPVVVADTAVAREETRDIPGPIAAELARRRAGGEAAAESGVSLPTGAGEAEGAGGEQLAGSQRLLRSILQELRGQRSVGGGGSWVTVSAVVLQVAVVVCFAGSLWMGSGSWDVFARWALAAVLAQLGVIAALMFDGRRG
ncbi:MAG: HAD-IIIA family hydrolase [Planctomycetota bacterium]